MTQPGMPKIDLSLHDWEEVKRILHACVPNHEVWAFGSRVRWTAKQYSDLDLAIRHRDAHEIRRNFGSRHDMAGSDRALENAVAI